MLYGYQHQFAATIAAANKEGFGVFFSVNQTDGKGHAANNIIDVLTWYTDIDGLNDYGKDAKMLELLNAELPPSAIVETKNGLHAYWYRTPETRSKSITQSEMESYKQTNLGIARRFGGDTSVKDIARVLRLPGTNHVKDRANPYPTTLLHELPHPPHYTFSEIREAYPPPVVKAREYDSRVVGPGDGKDWQKVLDGLMEWRPVETQRHHAMLLAVGVALKFGVSESEASRDLTYVMKFWGVSRDTGAEVKRAASWAYKRGTPTNVAALRNLGVPIAKLSRPPQ